MTASVIKKFLRSTRIIKLISELEIKIRSEREAKHAFSSTTIPPILVYQMGKVGSSTVYKSLINAGIPNPVLHLHFISEDIQKYRETFKNAGLFPSRHLLLGEAVRRVFLKNPYFPCKIISLIRDPIAFVVSDLFQNPYFAKDDVKSDKDAIDPEKAYIYLERELKNPETFSYVNEWFDRELKRVFDIDVFAEPFPVDVGYSVFKKSNIEALVIRLEDLSTKGPNAISELLGLEKPLILEQSNVRKESSEAILYQRVLKKIRLDPSLCQEIYSTRFVKQFYSKVMIEHLISKWTGQKSTF